MRCKQAKTLMLLYRAGERRARQTKVLAQHIETCPACAATYQAVREDRRRIESMKAEPIHKDPDSLTDAIMRNIPRHADKKRFSRTFADQFLQFIEGKTVRFALTGAVAVLVAFFLVQESLILNRLSRLEDRMASQSSEPISGQARFRQADFKTLQSVLEQNSQVSMDKESLDALLQSYHDLKMTNQLLLNLLREHSDVFKDITIDDGLDQAEINRLLSRRQALLQSLQTL